MYTVSMSVYGLTTLNKPKFREVSTKENITQNVPASSEKKKYKEVIIL